MTLLIYLAFFRNANKYLVFILLLLIVLKKRFQGTRIVILLFLEKFFKKS